MSGADEPPKARSAADQARQERLAQALRDNLKRRKARNRSRAADATAESKQTPAKT